MIFRWFHPFCLVLCAVLLLSTNVGSLSLVAQGRQTINEQKGFLFDALCFKGRDSADRQRVDVFVVVPFQHVRFEKKGQTFQADYRVRVLIRDENGDKLREEVHQRTLVEKEYQATVGSRGDFDYMQLSYALEPGPYSIDVYVRDSRSDTENSRSRNFSVIDFEAFPFSLSSIMLAGAIVEKEGRFSITPHVTDDVTPLLSEGYFAFFESYAEPALLGERFDIVYHILNDRGDIVSESAKVRKTIQDTIQQNFIKVQMPESLSPGKYTLKIIALRPDAPGTGEYNESHFLAVTERSVRLEWNAQFGPIGEENLDKAIKQLRYVANQSEYDKINNAGSLEAKRAEFFDFWKELDPTPNTLRNEAYEEYYNRIEFANLNYQSYSEGWLTDMGRVFIIFGPPQNVRRQNYPSDGKVVEQWTYGGNREFLFVDHSGFNDFRLATPLNPSEKYRYGR